jgi:hypothetical protein
VPTIHQIGVGVNRALTIRAPEKTTQLICHDLSIPRNAGDIKMKVNFTDPLTSGYLVAEVSPAKTASECVEALISNGCLGPGSYVLVANNKTLLPDNQYTWTIHGK